MIFAKTSSEFWSVSSTPKPNFTSVQPQAQLRSSSIAPTYPPPSKHALCTPGIQPNSSITLSNPESRIVYIKWPTVSLREGPRINFKSIVELKITGFLEEKSQHL